ncbi:ABC transporter substrate-binding protein [Cryptosporangium arvum]|uniref:ABC transporter substrate-binding protein n=1 Tax=Cryptosporangium arvum TaxID=80871 RepID=UPI00056A8CCF|nr:ABC transporter substrate-binding protein [Cryptosporangium arvum]
MGLSRRQVLSASLLAPVAALTGCGSGDDGAGKPTGTALWCWPGGLSSAVIADAVKRFAPDTRLTYTEHAGVFRTGLDTALSKADGVPAITGIKGEDLASYLPRADLFVDLLTLGADEIENDYLAWKWQQGRANDGRLVGIPIDIGPTAAFYRADVFGRAGLPTEPADVDAAMRTWTEFRMLGARLRRRLPDTFWIANTMTLFTIAVSQSGTRFVDELNRFVGDGNHIRSAWDIAIGASTDGLCAHVDNDAPEWAALAADGSIAVSLGAAWHAQDIEGAAPLTRGKWRVATGPAGDTNIGGSFLGIPASASDPDLSFRIIRWLLNPGNQARAFTDTRLFPSTPATYAMPALTVADPFFGGQRTIDVFSASARHTRRLYEAPADAAIQDVYLGELREVEYRGKAPAIAWRDALRKARRLADESGVN